MWRIVALGQKLPDVLAATWDLSECSPPFLRQVGTTHPQKYFRPGPVPLNGVEPSREGRNRPLRRSLVVEEYEHMSKHIVEYVGY